MWILLALAGIAPSGAAPILGADWEPFGRADARAVVAGETTELGVAPGDGLLDPALSAWGGWIDAERAFLGSVGVARRTTRSASGGDRSSAVASAVRLSMVYRHYLRPREAGRVAPWMEAGAQGTVPGARYRSSSWTAAEQEAWDEVAEGDRARIGSLGAAAGVGGELLLESGFSVGLRWRIEADSAVERTENRGSITVAIGSHTAFVLGLTF